MPRTLPSLPAPPAAAALACGLLALFAGLTVAHAGPQGPKKAEAKVRARAFLATDKLPAGRATTVAVVLDIQDGWHVRGAKPAEKYAIPTTVTVKTERGTTVGEFAFPTRPPLTPGGRPRPIEELHGRVVLRAPVTVPASAAGGGETLEVTVKYQACDAGQCLRPKTLTFGGTLPVAAPGEPVRPANREWFPADSEGRDATRTAQRP